MGRRGGSLCLRSVYLENARTLLRSGDKSAGETLPAFTEHQMGGREPASLKAHIGLRAEGLRIANWKLEFDESEQIKII